MVATGSSLPRSRCSVSGGKRKTAASATTPPSAATAKKGIDQPKRSLTTSAAGTPSTCATEKAPMTAPIALPRRAGGMTSAMMA